MLQTLVKRFKVVDTRTLRGKMEDENDKNFGFYSDKRLDQTIIKFYNSIDAALKETGIDSKQVARINRKARNIDMRCRMRVSRALTRICLPAYKLLRQQGYRHYELVK